MVPKPILNCYGKVSITIDVYTVNRIEFFWSISRYIKFWTSRVMNDAKKGTLLKCLLSVQGVYQSQGISITKVFGDNEFEYLQVDLLALEIPITLNITGADQHDPLIERDNRTSKKRCRCTFAALLFKKIQPCMTVQLMNGFDF